MCEDQQKPEAHSWKAKALELELCSWKEELNFTVSFLGRLYSPEIIQTVAGHVDDPE